MKYIIYILMLLPLAAPAFETDDAKNRKVMANEVFYKADTQRDYKFTPEDGKTWETYQDLDSNSDGVVTFEEFAAGADLPYPAWDGEVLRNIVYKRAGGEALLLDVYLPKVKKYDRAPVFYYTHGGGWSGGRKELKGAQKAVFEALSEEGFVCVGVMYRLVKMWNRDDPVIMRDCVVDCRDGLRFLKKHEAELGLDMDRVVVFGGSAGGHIAQLLTFSAADDFKGDASLFDYKVSPVAGISWYGPSDFRDTRLFATEDLEDKFAPDHWANRITKTDPFEYADADEKTKQMVDEVSPVVYLKKDSAPLLHIHGDQDVVISPNHAHHLQQRANECGAPVQVEMVKGAGHGWWAPDIEPDRRTIEQITVDFALKHAGEGD
jgi:acetyl esterase/lipase